MNKQKVTIYFTGEFFGSVQAIEAYLVEHGRRRYAQYDSAPYVVFVPKGKRKARVLQKSYKPYLLIVEGMFEASKVQNDVIIKKSKYLSHDDRYKTDFNKAISNSNLNIIADYREPLEEE